MKILITSFLLLFSIVSFGQNKNEVTIRLGFHCDHFDQCETGKSRLEKELVYSKGIKTVKTDSEKRTVTIRFNPKRTSEQEIRETIARSGYDADDVKADPKGIAKLDECCKIN